MKKLFIAAGVMAASLMMLTAKNADPVLMTVGGKDVPLSEFEYLFHKNNAQQVEPQTIDQYVGMFINYKMKVADAEAAGIDTTAAFREEFEKFRNELADPFLQDTTVMEDLVEEAYRHKGEEVLVSHIMLRTGQDDLLDSLRTAILDGKAKFEDVAGEYSIDTPSAKRGGLMGVVNPGRYPWAFEEMAYNTAVGEISPVINSGFGVHVIRVESRNPSKGEVKARHILRETRNMTDLMEARQKALIDSIYEVVSADPSKFDEIAREMSQDPGSARNGGDLGWFGHGLMVAEFDSVSFSMPVGAISKPFKTAFGWHIIKKDDERGIGSLEENRAELEKLIANSDRAKEPEKAYLRAAASRFGARLIQENIDKVAALADAAGSELDAAMLEALGQSDLPVYAVGNKQTTLGQLAATLQPVYVQGGANIQKYIANAAQNALDAKVVELAREELAQTNPEYRNLVNEYRDGILLYEISNRNVWDRAAKDREGLEKYFRDNKSKYVFEQPKFKAFVIFAANDSTLNSVLEYAASLPDDMLPTDLVKSVRDKFGREIKIERVIAAKGENAITDYLGFGGEKPENDKGRWKSYAAFKGHVIDQPEEASDVRGAAVTDYQEQLENQWISDMHRRYKVKVNQKVLKQVK